MSVGSEDEYDARDAAARAGAWRAAEGRTPDVLGEVYWERERQRARWGEQDHPSFGPGSGSGCTSSLESALARARARNAERPSWETILREEVLEARLAPTRGALRAELVQVAAVAVAWIEALDRRADRHSGGAP